jgi:hypothetical protein
MRAWFIAIGLGLAITGIVYGLFLVANNATDKRYSKQQVIDHCKKHCMKAGDPKLCFQWCIDINQDALDKAEAQP